LAALLLYVTLAVTVIFQEEVAPVGGALAAHHGHGDIWMVGVVCALGSWAGDLALYIMGRRGRRLFDRAAFRRALDLVRDHPRLTPLMVRFAYGLRFSLPVACGAARVPFPRYALWVGVSAFLWSGVFTALGWLAGEAALRLFHDVEHYEYPAMAAAAIIGLTGFVLLHRRNRLRAAHDVADV